MKIYIKLQTPYEWVRVDGGKVDAFGEVLSLDEYPMSNDDEVIGVVSGEWVTAHEVVIPAKTKKKFYAALPYALEDAISEDIEQMHFVCPQWKSGEASTVFTVSKKKMAEWQSLANEHGLLIARLIPDHALIPFHDVADYSVALTDEQILTNHQNGYGVSFDQEFLDLWLMDVPLVSTIAVNDQSLAEKLIEDNPDRDIRHWPFGNKMAHWLEYVPKAKFDLWTETFRPRVKQFSWAAFVVPMLIVTLSIVLKLGFDSYRYMDLHSEIREIDAEMQRIVKTTFPEIDFVEKDREPFMMDQAVSRLGGIQQIRNAQTMLAEISTVLGRQKVTIESMIYHDSQFEIICQLNDFSQVDRLTKELNARPMISASLQSSTADDGVIEASYTIKQS